ncbi:hypothetical protein B0H17DRAFT_1216160 [Mycena rosella]|uniref:DUF1857-domain-containing protein n=1 Tax=Mycena rosella TaxID=1033263 RepID=A0AAD7FWK0_MYCRO|nr:hypothetical protein B0H17DRAFT_1216160 [Mycena rosella]
MMYSFAITRPVNPPGAAPVLTEEQLWKGLEYKARNPAAFVPMISSSKTTFDEGNKLVRELTLPHSPDIIKEEIASHAATIMYFEMSTGLRITNVISYGPENELLLTYSFANGLPGVPADKPKPSAEVLNAIIGKALSNGLVIFRQMVEEGKL